MSDVSKKPDHESENQKNNLIGTTLAGKYRIESLLGTGGMGSVYKAHHLSFDKSVAVKVLNFEPDGHATRVDRFKKEASALQRLSHPNIVGFYAFDITNGLPYAVIEYLQGKTLSEVLLERKTLNESECIQIFSQILDAVEEAHAQGIIHRDLKPSNVLLVRSPDAAPPHVKVLDFGLSKMVDASTNAQKVTKTGELLGTPLYMSPEQCIGQQATPLSDLYSVGCMLYEGLTGNPPFHGESAYFVLMQHLEEAPPALNTDIERPVSSAFEALVQKALSKHPEQRFQSAHEFKIALQQAPKIKPGAVKTALPGNPRPKQRNGNRRGSAIILMICAVALSGGVLVTTSWQQNTKDAATLTKDAEVYCRSRDYEAACKSFKQALEACGGETDETLIATLKSCFYEVDTRLGNMMHKGEVKPKTQEPPSIIAAQRWLGSTYVEVLSARNGRSQAIDVCRLIAKRAALPRLSYQDSYIGGDPEVAEKYLLEALEFTNRNPDIVKTEMWESLGNIAKNISLLLDDKLATESDLKQQENYKNRIQRMSEIRTQTLARAQHSRSHAPPGLE